MANYYVVYGLADAEATAEITRLNSVSMTKTKAEATGRATVAD